MTAKVKQGKPSCMPRMSLRCSDSRKPFVTVNQILYERKDKTRSSRCEVMDEMKSLAEPAVFARCSSPHSMWIKEQSFPPGSDCGFGQDRFSWSPAAHGLNVDAIGVHCSQRASIVLVVWWSLVWGGFLWRTCGTVGRAGVRWRAGLLLVLWRAVRLQQCHGWWRVLTFWRTAFTAEQLAFDFPEVVAVVKSKRERWEVKEPIKRKRFIATLSAAGHDLCHTVGHHAITKDNQE